MPRRQGHVAPGRTFSVRAGGSQGASSQHAAEHHAHLHLGERRSQTAAHAASPSERLHRRFYQAIGYPDDWEDPSNKLLDVETQLHWLRELGFEDVDCYWKWLEMALLIGVKPAEQLSEQRAG